MLHLNDYDYGLPDHLIAQTPAKPADSCKLLVYNKNSKEISDTIFDQLPHLLEPTTLIVFNTSKVIKARIPIHFSDQQKDGEVFYLHAHDSYSFDALVRPGKKFSVGETISLDDKVSFIVEAVTEDGRRLRCTQPILEVLETYGQMPLPPYISYDDSKASPYQPIFAQQPGSVASPTASLHFTPNLMERLRAKSIDSLNIVLHVGLGTFKQVDTEDITKYKIHSEEIEITCETFEKIAQTKSNGKKVLAVGTTVARSLETLPYLRKVFSNEQKESLFSQSTISYRNTLTSSIALSLAEKYVQYVVYDASNQTFTLESKLFIYPGFTFHVIDELITNFHLPKSSLLMLVAGLMGFEEMKKVYEYAIANEYRFYSFGDAMRIRQ